jgi:copper homeostasis protein
MILEVIAQSVEDAIAAEAGGADRLELVRDLEADGLTPAPELVAAVCRAVRIPVYAMVRPRNAFMLEAGEVKVLAAEAGAVVAAGARGVVVGYRDAAGSVETTSLAAVRRAVGPRVCITFHRAFDRLSDPPAALPVLAAHGVERVLTSGEAATALEGKERLRAWAPLAARHGLALMAGGGLIPENVAALIRETGVGEVHFGAGVREPPHPAAPVSRERVAAAWKAVQRAACNVQR